MSKSIYGYVRVSTKEQNLDRQLIAMREYGVPEKNIFIDKQSGKDFDRPACGVCDSAGGRRSARRSSMRLGKNGRNIRFLHGRRRRNLPLTTRPSCAGPGRKDKSRHLA